MGVSASFPVNGQEQIDEVLPFALAEASGERVPAVHDQIGTLANAEELLSQLGRFLCPLLAVQRKPLDGAHEEKRVDERAPHLGPSPWVEIRERTHWSASGDGPDAQVAEATTEERRHDAPDPCQQP